MVPFSTIGDPGLASEVMKLNDAGESYCRIVDPASGPIHVPILEISSQGALLDTKISFQPNDYIDLTLALKGLATRPLFAHVVTADQAGLRLRWLHFDPGDEEKLRLVLDAFKKKPSAAADSLGATKQPSDNRPKPPAEPPPETQRGTRRVIRPNSVITPFADPTAKAPAILPGGERTGTRRVVRPSDPKLTPQQPAAKTPAPPKPPGDMPVQPSKALDVGEASRVIIDEKPALNADKPGGESSGSRDAIDSADVPGDGSSGKRISIIGKDGKLDIGASIRSKAKTVRASELAARHDRVKVLNMATIKGLIQEAVGEAVTHLTANIDESERKRLLEEAEQSFQERLKAFQAEKSGWEAQSKNLHDQLSMAQKLLADERKRQISADQFTVSEAGMTEIEDKMRRVLSLAVQAGSVNPGLEEELRTLISHILDSERDRMKHKELEAQNAKIDLLEKKIQRLAGTLEETERQRDEAQSLAAALEEAGGGLRNVFTAGVKGSEAEKKRKLALMKEILDINRQIRKDLGIELNVVEVAQQTHADSGSGNRSAVESAKQIITSIFKSKNAEGGEAAAEAMAEAVAEAVAPQAEPESTAETEEPAAPEIDPDDMEWQVQPIAIKDEGSGGIKRINVPLSTPPPLERK